MAGKTMNSFAYKGERYSIIGVSGDSLPHPQDFDIDLSVLPTSDEGYGYTLRCTERDTQFVLDQFLFNCYGAECTMDESVLLNDVKLLPVQYSDLYRESEIELPDDFEDKTFGLWYNGIDLELDFSGGILLGGGNVIEGSHYLDPKYPFAYDPVIELVFESGKLIQTADHADRMMAWRVARKEQDDLRSQKRKELGAELGMKFNLPEEVWDEAYALYPRIGLRDEWAFIREYDT